MSRRQEWRKHVNESAHEREGDRLRMLGTMAMAEVPAERLARGEEWRLFQQNIQKVIDVLKAELDGIKAKLIDPALVSVDEIAAVKNRGAIVQDRIEVLTGVLELPKKLQEDAHAARKWLEGEQWTRNSSN